MLEDIMSSLARPAPIRLSVADVVVLWVLSNPTPQETKTLQNAVERAGKAVELELGGRGRGCDEPL